MSYLLQFVLLLIFCCFDLCKAFHVVSREHVLLACLDIDGASVVVDEGPG